MPDVDDAVRVVTEPASVSDAAQSGPEARREVKQKRVLSALRRAGAGKAEARELALQALERLGGEVETHIQRGEMRAGGERTLETWWIPAAKVRWDE